MTAESSLFLTQGGNYSLQSRLNEVRGKLFGINKKVNELEYNMIFLLVRPDLINYSSSEDNNNHQQTGSEDSGTQSHATDNSAYYKWEPTFITNPAELHGKIADYMGIRYGLLINQKELIESMDAEKSKGPDKNEVRYYYHGSDNGTM